MANTSRDSNGSQFFINQTSKDAFNADGGWTKYEDWWNNVKTQLVNYKDSSLLSAFIQENGDKCYDTDIIGDEIKKSTNFTAAILISTAHTMPLTEETPCLLRLSQVWTQ